MDRKDSSSAGPSAEVQRVTSSPYAFQQLVKAMTTSQSADVDDATRASARQKINNWLKVINGITDGSIQVGSRTPVTGIPAWATPRVVTGGFATGELAAGGELAEFELSMAETFLPEIAVRGNPVVDASTVRSQLNRFFLTERGFTVLVAQLESGKFMIELAEEAALLVAAWLTLNQENRRAAQLIGTIKPYFRELRFYPRPADRPPVSQLGVHLSSVGEVKRSLATVQTPRALLAQHERIAFWNPLYDQLVALVLESVEGDPPDLDAGGNVIGGTPLVREPNQFSHRVSELIQQIDKGSHSNRYTKRPIEKSNFRQIAALVAKHLHWEPLTESEIRRLRLLLARYVHKYGLPGSDSLRQLRQRQADQIDIVYFRHLAEVLIQRLAQLDTRGGIDDVSSAIAPIAETESNACVKHGQEIPESFVRKINRAAVDTVESLVQDGVIGSNDVLAKVLPQITASIQSQAVADASLRRLVESMYRAFRKRRSLLLLNMQSQVKIHELPWFAVLRPFMRSTDSGREVALATLREIVKLALVSFPQAILPNKLLQEIVALAKVAGLDLPIVDELAADIFMGDFSVKFIRATRVAGDLLQNSIYSRYYEIDFDSVFEDCAPIATANNELAPFKFRHPANFARTCAQRANVSLGGWDVVKNGTIIEQQQILTTQNLGVLFQRLNLVDTIQPHLHDMVLNTFSWICRRLQLRQDWHSSLISIKNSAYAWRQLVFYLSLMPPQAADAVVTQLKGYLTSESVPNEFTTLFKPILNRLADVTTNGDNDRTIEGPIFLGWTQGRHYLMPEDVDW